MNGSIRGKRVAGVFALRATLDKMQEQLEAKLDALAQNLGSLMDPHNRALDRIQDIQSDHSSHLASIAESQRRLLDALNAVPMETFSIFQRRVDPSDARKLVSHDDLATWFSEQAKLNMEVLQLLKVKRPTKGRRA